MKSYLSSLVVSVAVLMQPAAQAQTPTLDSEQWALLALINNYRAQNKVAPLQVSVTLQNASQWMATDMGNSNYFGYRDSLRRFPGSRLVAFGYNNGWGEDIAEGLQDAQSVFNQWILTCTVDWTGACAYGEQKFMLDPSYVVIGIGRAYNVGSTTKWHWTVDMGTFKDQTISPGSAPPPIITNFSAIPATINAGSSTTLTWNLTGANNITLDNGFGDVSNLGFKSVSPTKTTTYTLIANNSGGSTTAKTTITVISFDTQPPTTPILISATPKSPTQVDLTWGASVDNVGVTAYQITRNGTIQGLFSGTNYSDTAVVASTTYTYSIKAVDAAGNYSASSNSVSATTPAPAPVTSTCPTALTNAFAGCYFGNTNLTGTPTKTTSDPQLMFDWSNAYAGRPSPLTNFSVRWQGNFTFAAGTYNFTTVTSDGMRVFIDGAIVLDKWVDQPPSLYNFRSTMTAGNHLVVVEFYNKTGWPISYLWWSKQ